MPSSIRIIGAPMDLGQAKRGVDMGPSAIRYAGLNERLIGLGHAVADTGNVPVSMRQCLPPKAGADYLAAIADACRLLYNAGRQTLADGGVPVFLGGDHSISIGTVGGVTHDRSCGVIWVDAHADFNTPESSPSGNVHGMPLAVLTGQGLPALVNLCRPGAKIAPGQVVMIGLRNLDPEERLALRRSGVTVFTMRDIDELGLAQVARRGLAQLGRCSRLHLSLDMDALDPITAPGVGTPVPGGLTYREAHLLMEILADDGRVGSLDLVEINPILDVQNRTAVMAVELAASLFGQGIY